MTDLNQPPLRLIHDPAALADPALAGVRHDLELASNHAPLHYDVEAGLARFEQAMVGTKLATASGATLRVLGWVVATSVLLGGSIGAAKLMQESDAPRITAAMTPPQDLHTQDAPVAGPASLGTREPGEPVAEAGQPAGFGDAGAAIVQPEGGDPALDVPTPPRPDTIHPAIKPSSKPEPTPAPTPEPELDEAAQINAARKALASDPAKTLALMQAAEQQFPNGVMIQERRGYTILALMALGRTAEAEQQANAYLERWPNGPLSHRVREAVGR